MRRNQIAPMKEEVKPKEIPSNSKLDQRLIAGPLAERGCTDLICFILFIVSVGLMMQVGSLSRYIAQQGYAKGQPLRLIAAYDADKNACGLDVIGFPYLYWALPYTGYYNRTTCVSTCPTYTTEATKPLLLNCSINSVVTSCASNCFDYSNMLSSFPPSSSNPAFNLSQWVCIFNSTQVFSRICSPTLLISALNNSASFSAILNLDQFTGYVTDLKTTQYAIYGSFGIAFLLGLIYLLITRYLAGLLVWLCIILYFIGLGLLAYWSDKENIYYTNIKNDTTGKYTVTQQTDASNNQQTFQYFTYILYGIIGASMIAFCCIYNKLRLAIAIIKTAALFVRDQFFIVFVPPVIACFIAGLWFWWVYTALYIVGMGTITGTGQDPFAVVTFTTQQKQYLWYFLFGGLWKNAFLQALNSFIIASTVCIWYFSQNGMDGGDTKGAISRSIYRAFRYHLGSLAFGSLLLAIVQIIRIALEYIKYQMEKTGQSENSCVKFILKCAECLMACFERFIRFLTYNAYIMVALTGKNFCFAAKEAFETIWANAMRFSLVQGIGGAFIIVGKFCITAVTVMIFYYIITEVSYFSKDLYSPVFPCGVVFIIAYGVSVLFMSIYGMACDAILLCFIYDEDLNKMNGGQSAQHCPETLREFLELDDMKGLKEG